MALEPGTRLGPYEILAPLGAGGMGEVYKGRDTRLDRLVALKLLAPHLAANREARERFEREATTVAKLKHAHICLLYDIGSQELEESVVRSQKPGEAGSHGTLGVPWAFPGPNPEPAHGIKNMPWLPAEQPEEQVLLPPRRDQDDQQGARRTVRVDYLVFEYLEGETLSQRLARGPLPLGEALQYAVEIADALDKAHRAGVTHRDIKPGNIMLVPTTSTASPHSLLPTPRQLGPARKRRPSCFSHSTKTDARSPLKGAKNSSISQVPGLKA
jgi:serine/threonine protein kinase